MYGITHTDELVGHAFSWSYSNQTTSMHLYTSPAFHVLDDLHGPQTMGAQWCSPCIYTKLRDGVYLFCQNEEACNGAQMIELINTKISHDCGFSFNGGAKGVNLGVIGAIGRHIGKFDITELLRTEEEGGVMSILKHRNRELAVGRQQPSLLRLENGAGVSAALASGREHRAKAEAWQRSGRPGPAGGAAGRREGPSPAASRLRAGNGQGPA